MATNKTVTVTVLPTLTGDTVASYNVYEGVSGTTLLGTMSVAEAAAGKVFAFTNGIIHSVKVQTVWTTAGASAIRSAGVELDLSVGTEYKVVLDQEEAQWADDGQLDLAAAFTTCKLEFKTSAFPNEASATLLGLGRNLPATSAFNDIRVAHFDADEVYIGRSAGFVKYLKADLINKDVIVNFDYAAGTLASSIVVTADGPEVTQSGESGSLAQPLGYALQLGMVATVGGTTSVASATGLEYVKATRDGVLTHDLLLNDGSGTVITNQVVGEPDLTIDVGTGSISTVWVAL